MPGLAKYRRLLRESTPQQPKSPKTASVANRAAQKLHTLHEKLSRPRHLCGQLPVLPCPSRNLPTLVSSTIKLLVRAPALETRNHASLRASLGSNETPGAPRLNE